MTLAGAPFGAPPRLFSARAALSRRHLRRRDQPTLGGGTVVSPRRSPGSPECRVTSPARGSRPSLHPPNVSASRAVKEYGHNKIVIGQASASTRLQVRRAS